MEKFTRQVLEDLLNLAEDKWDFDQNWEAWALATQNARAILAQDTEQEIAVKTFMYWLKAQDITFAQVNKDGTYIFLSPNLVLGQYLLREEIASGELSITTTDDAHATRISSPGPGPTHADVGHEKPGASGESPG
jgi:hypothetical protein